MKNDILLSDFIAKVKEELMTSQCDPEEAFYELTDVELDVSFTLSSTGKAKGKLVVLELGGESTVSQAHHIKLKLKPVGNRFKQTENNLEDDVIKGAVALNKEDEVEVGEKDEGFIPPSQNVLLKASGGGGFTRERNVLGKYRGPLYQKRE